MEKLDRIRMKNRKLVIGLMSGTSVDGVDCALCSITGHGAETDVKLFAFHTFPYPQKVKNRIHGCFHGTVKDVCELNFVLGKIFADACLSIAKGAKYKISDVDLIGTHGQTVYHIPKNIKGINSTLQIGEAAVIAEQTGCIVVSDFRQRDIAAGGTGAPLIPYIDHLLFAHPKKVRALQNIGGIANVTLLPGKAEEIIAFDNGPGNMVIDEISKRVMEDPASIDIDGKLSSLGGIDYEFLEKVLMNHPYLKIPPPKSTGRETLGSDFAHNLIGHYDKKKLLNLLATVNFFTARAIHDSYVRFLFPKVKVDEIIISGGGAHNTTLVGHLKMLFDPIPVRHLRDVESIDADVKSDATLTEPRGWGFGDAKEAVAFAVLANETIHGEPGNVPSATGARHPVTLGKITV
jgi:anhydro-N-acetylmuramic acid kinase